MTDTNVTTVSRDVLERIEKDIVIILGARETHAVKLKDKALNLLTEVIREKRALARIEAAAKVIAKGDKK